MTMVMRRDGLVVTSINDEHFSFMKNLLKKRDHWGNHSSLWIAAALIFIAPLAWWSINQIRVQDNIAHWLPQNDPQSEILSWYQQQFDVEDQILITWEGSSLNDHRLQKFAEKIRGKADAQGIQRGGIPEIKTVITPLDLLNTMTKHHVNKEEALRRLEGVLIGRGSLKLELTDSGQIRKKRVIRQITEQAKSTLGLSLIVGPSSEELAEAEFGEEFGEEFETGDEEIEEEYIEQEGVTEEREFDLQLSWAGMHSNPDQVKQVQELLTKLTSRPTKQHTEGEMLVSSTFFEMGSPIAMAISLSEAGQEDEQLAFAKIKLAATEVGIDADKLHIAGRSVTATELNSQINQVIWNADAPLWKLHLRSPLLLSALVSIILAFVMLKSFRLTAIVIITTLYATLAAVAFVPMTGGSMNMVLVVMPTLLMVLTLSASIHVANYWKHATAKHPKRGISHAMKMASNPCVLAAMTTAVGLLSLTTSSLAPVRDFGFYTAIGCVISLVVVLYGMPTLLQLLPASGNRHRNQQQNEQASWDGLGNGIIRAWLPIAFVCLMIFAVCSCGLSHFKTESKIVRYFPADSKIVQDYNLLEENLSGIVPVELVIRFDKETLDQTPFLSRMETVRKIQEKMRSHPDISGTLSLTDFQPVAKLPSEKAKKLTQLRFARKSTLIEKRVKEGKEAESCGAYLSVATEDQLFHKADGSTFTVQAGDELWRITAQVPLLAEIDYASLCGDATTAGDLNNIAQSELKYLAGANHVITGTVPLFMQTQQAVLDSLIGSTALAFGAIAVIMMILLKNPIAGLLAMLPNMLPIGVVLGLISWNGLAIDIGTMVTAAVALGIAVDGTLHLLTWFKAGIELGQTREQAIIGALKHCGTTMLQTSAIVAIGLLTIFPSELLLVHRFSWMMACLIGCALVADIIFLPALLAGPLGSLIESSLRKKKQIANPIQRTDDPLQKMLNEIAASSMMIDNDTGKEMTKEKITEEKITEEKITEEHDPHPHVIKISRPQNETSRVD